jgi:hypothetical protein
MARIEAELIARNEAEQAEQLRIINEDDAKHCRLCELESGGCNIAGCHVQTCDSCLAGWVREQIGHAIYGGGNPRRHRLANVYSMPILADSSFGGNTMGSNFLRNGVILRESHSRNVILNS